MSTEAPRLGRFIAVVCLAAAALLYPQTGVAQATRRAATELTPALRERLVEATHDSRLAAWQRDTMVRLAETPGGAEPTAHAGGETPPPTPSQPSVVPDGSWDELVIASRYEHTAIYDPVRERMVVFGGGGSGSYDFDDVWALSLAVSPVWTRLTPAGTPPSGRVMHTAIYDPVRDRMVVFAGVDLFGYPRNDVWALSLAANPVWTQLTPDGTPPSGTFASTAIYDPLRDRMVVFGGECRNDVWALSLAGSTAWAQLNPAGTPPIGRMMHTAIYDPVRDRMLVFGGLDCSGEHNDVWALSLAGSTAWTQLNPTGVPPSGRWIHTAIYDPALDRMIVFGGQDGPYASNFRNDVWALSLRGTPAWTQLTPDGTPPSQRGSHTAIYDPAHFRMVVFGGDNGVHFNDVWALSLARSTAWVQLTLAGTPPSERDRHTAIYDPVRDRMVVFAGLDNASPRNDVWTLSLAVYPVWTQRTPDGTPPSRRGGHTAIYDPVRDRMVVFGGGADASNPSNVWALSLAGNMEWVGLSPDGMSPGRVLHTAIYDPARDRMVVFGGLSNGSPRNDVWTLSLAGSASWAQLTPAGTPPSGRENHTAIYDPVRDRMVVFGGLGNSYPVNDVWALSLAGNTSWAQLTPAGTPPNGRAYHSAIYDPVRDRMVVFGGLDNGSPQRDVWALSLAGSTAWARLTPAGTPPSPRESHTAIYDPARDGMVVFGGFDGDGDFCTDRNNEVWAMWFQSPIAAPPVPRSAAVTLAQNFPNPFNPATTIEFSLSAIGPVSLIVYDMRGRLVRKLVSCEQPAGRQRIVWDATDDDGQRVGSGVYFYVLVTSFGEQQRKMIVVE
jgi:hypothetical protein